MFNKAEHYFILFFIDKYLWIFNASDVSIELKSTEKSYTFPFKNTSLDSVGLNSLDMLLRQNCVGKLTFLLSALNLNILLH